MKIALYHRVSTVDQDPTIARDALHAAAESRGFEISMDVEESASGAVSPWATAGGGRKDRPGLRAVLEAAARREVDAVAVWKLDRFGRSTLDVLSNVKALREAGCRFICVTQGIDVGGKDDAVGSLILTILAGVAEFERELIRERVILGLAKAKRQGKRLGRPMKGPLLDVKVIEDLRSQKLSWDEIDAALGCDRDAARRAYRRAGVSGYSKQARKQSNLHLPTPLKDLG